MAENLPEGLVLYAQTEEFTADTMPAKLGSAHNTKPGVWGRLIVLEGALDYIVLEPSEQTERIEAGGIGVIAPGRMHRVEAVGAVRFKIEFLRQNCSGAQSYQPLIP